VLCSLFSLFAHSFYDSDISSNDKISDCCCSANLPNYAVPEEKRVIVINVSVCGLSVCLSLHP